jgi:hypothetical protein
MRGTSIGKKHFSPNGEARSYSTIAIFDREVKSMLKLVCPSIALTCALGLALPTIAFADTTEPAVHHRTVSPHRTHMTHRERMRVEGLSGNPDNCVRYGCVGNN